MAFREEGAERGLAWSDMAILLRSVKRNGGPITSALDAAGIPYVVSGMTNLFGAKEAGAARQLFYFIAGREGVDEAAVRAAWTDADLGLDPDALRAGVAGAAKIKAALHATDEKRWGVYSIQRVFLTFLEEVGLREETVPAGRGEVAFFNLGKFSQLISDYETIHYRSAPSEKYESFAKFLQYRAGGQISRGMAR